MVYCFITGLVLIKIRIISPEELARLSNSLKYLTWSVGYLPPFVPVGRRPVETNPKVSPSGQTGHIYLNKLIHLFIMETACTNPNPNPVNKLRLKHILNADLIIVNSD